MTIKYAYTFEDIVAWNMFVYKHRTLGAGLIARHIERVRRWIVLGSIGFSAAIGISSSWEWSLAALAGGLVAFFCYPIFYAKELEKLTRKFLKTTNTEKLFGVHQMTFSEDGLKEIGPQSTSEIKWSSVVGVFVEDERLFIALPGSQAAVIHRDTLEGPVSFDELPTVIEKFRQCFISKSNT